VALGNTGEFQAQEFEKLRFSTDFVLLSCCQSNARMIPALAWNCSFPVQKSRRTRSCVVRCA